LNLTTNELQFITVLWNADEPLTGAGILNRSVNKTWMDKSLHTLLKSMLQKGAIREVGFRKEGKKISRLFEAAVSCEEYYSNVFNGYKGENAVGVLSALLKGEDIDQDVIRQLEDVIEKRKTEL